MNQTSTIQARFLSAVFSTAVLFLAVPLQAAGPQEDAKWGDLVGRFYYDGVPLEQLKLRVRKDVVIDDESLIVAADGGIKNVLVYLRTKPQEQVDVHPSYECTADAEVPLVVRDHQLHPHITLLRTSQTLAVTNEDSEIYTIRTQPIKNPNFGALMPPARVEEEWQCVRRRRFLFRRYQWQRTTRTIAYSHHSRLRESETIPTSVACNIHPWIKSYLIVRDNPYLAVTNADGEFRIKNLPVGRYEFQLWHEAAGYLKDVRIKGKKAVRGRIKVEIKAGENHIGDVAVPPAMFEHRFVPPFPRAEPESSPEIKPPLAKTGLVAEPR